MKRLMRRLGWLVGLVVALAWVGFSLRQGPSVWVQWFGRPGGSLGRDVSAALLSDDLLRKEAAAGRLIDLGPEAREVLPTIRAVLESREYVGRARWLCAFAASRMGAEAADIMALASVDAESELVPLGEASLGKLAPSEQVAALQHLVDGSDDGEARRKAIRWIGSLGANAAAEFRELFSSVPVRRPGVEPAEATRVATWLLSLTKGSFGGLPEIDEALVRLGAPAAGPLGAALTALAEPGSHPWQRRRLYGVVQKLGPLAEAVMPALVRCLPVETSAHFQKAWLDAALAIKPRGATLALLVEALEAAVSGSSREEETPVASGARAALRRLPVPETLASLRVDLQREVGDDRSWQAARLMGEMGPAAAELLPDLAAAMTSTWSTLRVEAAWAYGEIGGDLAVALPVLICALDHERSEVRGMASLYLGGFGEKAGGATGRLLQLLEGGADLGATDRVVVLDVLARIDRARPDVTERLRVSASEDPDGSVRAVALGKWLDRPRPTVDLTVAEALADLRGLWSGAREPGGPDRSVRIAECTDALVAAGSTAAVPLARWLVEDGCPYEVSGLFERLGAAGAEALPVLTEAAENGSEATAQRALRAIMELGAAARPAVPTLLAVSEDRRDYGGSLAGSIVRRWFPEDYVEHRREVWPLVIILAGALVILAAVVGWARWGRLTFRRRDPQRPGPA